MNLRWAGFSLCTVILHLALFWLLWQETLFMHGGAGNTRSADHSVQVMKIGLVPAEVELPRLNKRALKEPSLTPNPAGWIEKISNQVSIPALEENRPLVNSAVLTDTLEESSRLELAASASAAHDYALIGQLTRLPAPLVEIDLNIPGINDFEFEGKIDLTILIDTNGTVADVITLLDDEQLRPFSERIAARFKTTRFIPGEINGLPVKSQLQITVVSEKLYWAGN